MKSKIESNKNHRVFRVRCLGWTNTKPSRIQISEDRGGITERQTISWTDATTDNARKEAQRYLESIGIYCEGHGEFGQDTYLFSSAWGVGKDSFINLKGKKS